MVMMGDFNCREVIWEELRVNGSDESWGGELLSMAMENSMTQWVGEHTRFRGEDEPSRLDLIFTGEPEILNDIKCRCPLGRSDHVVIECELRKEKVMRRNEVYKEGRNNYGKTNFVELRNYFEQVDWTGVDQANGVEEGWSEFKNIYEQGVEKWVPKMKKRNIKIQEWFNKRCEKATETRDKAWSKWTRRRTTQTWETYKKARNEYTKVRREEARKYEKDIVDKCKEEPKLFYRFVNGKLKNKKEISRLKVDGSYVEEESEMAEALNNYFQEVFTKERDFIEPDSGPIEDGGLGEIEISNEEVREMLRELDVRKASGPDGVSSWILKECGDQLASKIRKLIMYSIQEGKVPKDWKRADIVPIFKSGNKESPGNYRPVSLTSVVAKLCEKVIKKRWSENPERRERIAKGQFGFRKGRSCVTNLLCFYSRVIDVVQEREGWADGIYLDLRKAFDKVPHKRLIWKLRTQGGLEGTVLKWICDFLNGREMRTVIRGRKSTWKEVTSGVPQGSVLAPLLFAVYVNDMMEGVSSYISLFADDAKLMRRVNAREDCEALQEDINKIWEWSKMWQMDFNIKKCGVMNFGKSSMRPEYDYRMGNERLEIKTKEKDLGVIVTEKLSPETHVSKKVGEAYSLLRSIRAAFSYMDEAMMKKLIVTMIRPRLEYAVVFWSPSTKRDKGRLERVQRAATKLPPTLADKPYEERLKTLDLCTMEQRR